MWSHVPYQRKLNVNVTCRMSVNDVKLKSGGYKSSISCPHFVTTCSMRSPQWLLVTAPWGSLGGQFQRVNRRHGQPPRQKGMPKTNRYASLKLLCHRPTSVAMRKGHDQFIKFWEINLFVTGYGTQFHQWAFYFNFDFVYVSSYVNSSINA